MPKKLNVDKVSEGIDYKLIPVEDSPNDQAWDIRILRGDFTETVIRYGNVAFNEIQDCLTFNYKVVFSPDPLLTSDDIQLQEYAADILEDILETAFNEGWAIAQPRT
jgi:hypothetical protein